MRIKILGTPIDALTVPQVIRRVGELIESSDNFNIVTPNPEFVLDALADDSFAQTLCQASLSLPDGIGIVWASRYLSVSDKNKWISVLRALGLLVLVPFSAKTLFKVIPERITGVDMVMEIAKLANDRGYRLYFLGGTEGVAEATAKQLTWLYGRLRVAGYSAGPPYEEEEQVINRIIKAQPDLVFLAFPQKEQLRWIKDVLPKMKDMGFMGIGGAFDFIVGAVPKNDPTGRFAQKRAPLAWQQNNLEWLWRLVTQPWRYQRIWRATVGFVGEVIRYKFKHLNSTFDKE